MTLQEHISLHILVFELWMFEENVRNIRFVPQQILLHTIDYVLTL